MRRLVIEEPVSGAARAASRLAVFAALVMALAVLVVRSGQHDPPGLATLAAGPTLAALALVLALAGATRIWRTGARGARHVAVAAIIAMGLLLPAAIMLVRGLSLPVLNDISTDLETPPGFSRSRAALEARRGHVPPERDPAERERQREAYSKLVPVISDLSVDDSLALVSRALSDLGWQIIERRPADARSGIARLEAIVQTPVLRFHDDITVRIRPRADGSRIDIRSASRVGRHDFGTNAAHVRALIDQIDLLLRAR